MSTISLVIETLHEIFILSSFVFVLGVVLPVIMLVAWHFIKKGVVKCIQR